MLSEAKVYIDGVTFSARRLTENDSGAAGGFSFAIGGGDFRRFDIFGVGTRRGTEMSGFMCGNLTGRGASIEPVLFRAVGPCVLLVGFCGGKGSLAVYSERGDPDGVASAQLIAGEFAWLELELPDEPFRGFLGRSITSCFWFELLIGTRATVGPLTRDRELVCAFLSKERWS